jgi:tetratricopeptide (TPR) repeat protein
MHNNACTPSDPIADSSRFVDQSRSWCPRHIGFVIATVTVVVAAAQEGNWGTSVDRAAALQRQGRYKEAETAYLAAYAAVKTLPYDDPRLAYVLSGLCSIYCQTWRPGEAEKFCLRALAAGEQGAGETAQANLLNSLQLLFTISLQSENTARARELVRRLEKLLAAAAPAEPRLRGLLPYDRGLLDLISGRNTEAAKQFSQAIDVLQTCPEEPNLLAAAFGNLCLVSIREHRYIEAESQAHQAIQILDRRFGPDHVEMAGYLNNLGMIYSLTDRAGEAEPLVQRALSIAQAGYGPDDISVRNILVTYARILRQLNRKAEAKAMERRAKDLTQRLEGGSLAPYLIDARMSGHPL